MKKEIELSITPDFINDEEHQKKLIAKKLKIDINEITAVKNVRRSLDARGRQPVFKIKKQVYINESSESLSVDFNYKNVENEKSVLIVGSGPAGLFAALQLIGLGIKPIIIERGKDVRSRRKDLKDIQQNINVNSESNYCFGEGGAGTYSDGKLYTRSTKRGNIENILNQFVYHGALEDILIDAHPHIGSNKLPKIITGIRETIIKYGGEILFNSKLTDIVVENNSVKSAIINNEKEYSSDAIILASGHSARDIYYLLDKNKIELEQKQFAMGVRIEHPQSLIDSIQYRSKNRHENLPASSYNLTCQVNDRGVYSFCMCPGGVIIPASTDNNELVLNGMSVSRRDSKFANSGVVVSVTDEDLIPYNNAGVFAGLEFQKHVEEIAFNAGGNCQTAPAQLVTDFSKNILSKSLNETSYIPGIVSAPLHELLPKSISKRLQIGIKNFGKRMPGYYSEQGQILAAETRTSSPLRIPRDKETLMHVRVKGLFPCGEGAGYAGGIISAAIDGERCAKAAVSFVNKI